MYKSNVLTCSNILKFAEKKKNIKIFHISTKHVGFGSVPDKKDVLFSESEFNVGQRAIIYNGEQVEKWIDNCREFEKALDRSEVFRSVL